MDDIKELFYIYKKLIKYKEFQYISKRIKDEIITSRLIIKYNKKNYCPLFSDMTFRINENFNIYINYEALQMFIKKHGIDTLFEIFVACKNSGHCYRIVRFGVYDYYNNRIYPLLNFINVYGR